MRQLLLDVFRRHGFLLALCCELDSLVRLQSVLALTLPVRECLQKVMKRFDMPSLEGPQIDVEHVGPNTPISIDHVSSCVADQLSQDAE